MFKSIMRRVRMWVLDEPRDTWLTELAKVDYVERSEPAL